ncbi:MAG TPA: type II toxin-antitoxin system VapC family toxin [Vicinamibacterales bacterium]|jgi:predicted nucleic acid-binding protein
MFWDSSALVPILLPEARSDALTALLATDREVVIWWATPLECQSALYRRHRDAAVPSSLIREMTERLRAFVEHADTIAPTDDVRRRAARLLASHSLRAADALQLAAALIWCEEQPHNETFVSLDDRLCAAARKEGFEVAP